MYVTIVLFIFQVTAILTLTRKIWTSRPQTEVKWVSFKKLLHNIKMPPHPCQLDMSLLLLGTMYQPDMSLLLLRGVTIGGALGHVPHHFSVV